MAETSNFNSDKQKPVVLVSPLDWGLGHTTRCIPIIQELLIRGCAVVIACNSVQKKLLESEFSDCVFVNLPGYDLHYGKNDWGTLGKICLQIPKILIRIKSENRWLYDFIRQNRIKGVISDNRFGLYHRSIASVFITHQLYIKTGLGRFSERLVQWFNYRQIQRFNRCWVPDNQGATALAGELSNPVKKPGVPLQYMGALSRLKPCSAAGKEKQLLIILSGPEPQRSLFEQMIVEQLRALTLVATLVRGLPNASATIDAGPGVTVLNHVPAAALNQLICDAEMVISRTGYTTVMDLLKLGKKSIMVPTPGQAEQVYLGAYLMKQQFAYTMRQENFDLKKALNEANEFNYRIPMLEMNAFKQVVGEFVNSLLREVD